MKKLSEFDGLIRNSGRATFELGGSAISFHLEHRHERAYAARLLLDVWHPQADIDLFIFQHFLRASDVVLDAGANIGVTALECLEVGVAKVIAVEALPALYERLAQLGSNRLTPVNKAISSSSGEADFYVSTAHNQGSSLNPEMINIFPAVFGDVLEKVVVGLTTIDDLVDEFGAFDVWKLDIEGAEVEAIRGARRTLEACPPRLIIAELYDDFYDEFYSEMKVSHPFVRRALIPLENYGLRLVPPEKGFPDGFHQTSPMYVLSNTPFE